MPASLRIGVISDTHGQLRPSVFERFAGVDRIVHAGDVGGHPVLEGLMRIAPVEAVSGNVDDRSDPRIPRARTLALGSLTLHVSHGDELGRPTPAGLLSAYTADIIVFGHTHVPLIYRAADGRLVVNPGGAGARRFGLRPSVAVLAVTDGHADAEIVMLE